MSQTDGTTHVMVDIETLGTAENSIILSIGAVIFDVDTGLGEEFYVEIDPEQDRNFDFSTLKWWATQETVMPVNGTMSLRGALRWFKDFLLDRPNLTVWAKGIDFDFKLLAHAYRNSDVPIPWKYSAVRDYRTIAKVFSDFGNESVANNHNALDDAKNQATHLISILRNLSEVTNVKIG